MAQYAQLGLDVAITEMDVELPAAFQGIEAINAQAGVYRTVARTCAEVSTCTSFTTWGVTDSYSWLGERQRPLLIDAGFQPKAAYIHVARQLGHNKAPRVKRIAGPSLILKLRCSGSAVRASVTGRARDAVRSVQFFVGRRRGAVDVRAPFSVRLTGSLVARGNQDVRARIAMRDGSRRSLDRPLPDC